MKCTLDAVPTFSRRGTSISWDRMRIPIIWPTGKNRALLGCDFVSTPIADRACGYPRVSIRASHSLDPVVPSSRNRRRARNAECVRAGLILRYGTLRPLIPLRKRHWPHSQMPLRGLRRLWGIARTRCVQISTDARRDDDWVMPSVRANILGCFDHGDPVSGIDAESTTAYTRRPRSVGRRCSETNADHQARHDEGGTAWRIHDGGRPIDAIAAYFRQ